MSQIPIARMPPEIVNYPNPHLLKIDVKKSVESLLTRINNAVMNTMPSIKEMQHAYLQKDNSYDGIFFLGVRTTGIFCRPSCPARRPLPTNVDYFSNAREALFAGYRPCKRCRPLETDGRPPEWVRRAMALVNDSEDRIRDSELRQSGID